jgi:hypothetical protein
VAQVAAEQAVILMDQELLEQQILVVAEVPQVGMAGTPRPERADQAS